MSAEDDAMAEVEVAKAKAKAHRAGVAPLPPDAIPDVPKESLGDSFGGLVRKGAESIPLMGDIVKGATPLEATRSALSGVTLGAAPKIVSGLDAVGDALTGDKSLGDAYAARLPENQAAYDAATKKAPTFNLGGGLISPANRVLGPLKAIKPIKEILGAAGIGPALARIATGAAEGGTLAGLQGALSSKKEGLDALAEGVHNVPAGMAWGGAASSIGEALTGGGKALQESVGPWAVKSFTHGGIGNKLATEGYKTPEAIAKLGQEAVDRGMVKFGRNAAYTQNAANKLMEQGGEKQSQIMAEAQDMADRFPELAASPEEAAGAMNAAAQGQILGSGPRRAALGQADKAAADMLATDPRFEAIRQAKSDMLRNFRRGETTDLEKEALRTAQLAIAPDLERQVGRALGPEAQAELHASNQALRAPYSIHTLAADEAQRAAQRSGLGLIPQILGASGIGGVASGNSREGLGAIGLALLSQLAKGRTWSSLATGANAAAPIAGALGGVASSAAPLLGRFEGLSDEDRKRLGAFLASQLSAKGAP